MPRPKINTMKELSEAIGVSRPTLSRYFQDPTSVRPSTSEKIKERLAEVDYVYNFLATRQNRKSTGLIGLILPYLEDLFYASLLEAIEAAARESGFTIIMQSAAGDPDIETQAVEKLRSMNADGAIIAPLGRSSSVGAFTKVVDEFPVVFVDAHPNGDYSTTDFVGTDNRQSVSSMVDFLCRTGDAPVFLGMPALNSNADERRRTYEHQMERLGHVPEIIETIGMADSWAFEAYGYDLMDRHFSHQRYTSATILCANDRLAIGAIRAANKHGLFPRSRDSIHSLRIAGHDDHPLSRYMFPSVTTVAQDIEGIGRDSVRLLIERIRGGRNGGSRRLLKQAVLRLRESA